MGNCGGSRPDHKRGTAGNGKQTEEGNSAPNKVAVGTKPNGKGKDNVSASTNQTENKAVIDNTKSVSLIDELPDVLPGSSICRKKKQPAWSST